MICKIEAFTQAAIIISNFFVLQLALASIQMIDLSDCTFCLLVVCKRLARVLSLTRLAQLNIMCGL